DINGIPLAAIERIEVLPSTASGIYGGGATGGVVNIVMKTDYAGVEVRAAYDSAFDTDAGHRRLEMSAGFSLEGGRTHAMLTAHRADSRFLLTGDRDFAQRGRALLMAHNPNPFDIWDPPYSTATNISSLDGDLVLDDGTPLGAAFATVPAGYAGADADGGAALLAMAGQYSLGIGDHRRQSLMAGPVTESVALAARRDFTPWLEMFLDSGWTSNEGAFETPSLNGS